jgi:hypothetical protein
MKTLSIVEAILHEGYWPRIVKYPARVKNGLGKGFPYMQARVYELSRPKVLSNGQRFYFGIAIKDNSWDHAYSVSHEIAEHRWNFKHSADMFCEQANLLARWLRTNDRA